MGKLKSTSFGRLSLFARKFREMPNQPPLDGFSHQDSLLLRAALGRTCIV